MVVEVVKIDSLTAAAQETFFKICQRMGWIIIANTGRDLRIQIPSTDVDILYFIISDFE